MGYDEDYRLLPITFERGLNESVEADMLPPGTASYLENWVADPAGNLRTRRGWQRGSTTSQPSVKSGLGMGAVSSSGGAKLRQVVGAGGTQSSSPASLSATWSTATNAGSLLVACLYWTHTSTATGPSFTPSAPAGWTALTKTFEWDVNSKEWFAVYYIENAASRSGAEQFTVAYANYMTLCVYLYEVTGGTGYLPVDTFYTATVATPGSVEWGSSLEVAASYVDDDFTVESKTAHGYSNGNKVYLRDPDGLGLPSGFSEGTGYYVVNATSTTFQLSDTLGGAAKTWSTTINDYFCSRVDRTSVGNTVPSTLVIGFASRKTNSNVAASAQTGTSGGSYQVSQELYTQNGANDDSNTVAFYCNGLGSGATTYEDVDVSTMWTSSTSSTRSWALAINSAASVTRRIVVANQDSSTTIGLYSIDRDNLGAGTWSQLEVLGGSAPTRPIAFTAGAGYIYYTHATFTATRRWSPSLEVAPSAITGSPAGNCRSRSGLRCSGVRGGGDGASLRARRRPGRPGRWGSRVGRWGAHPPVAGRGG